MLLIGPIYWNKSIYSDESANKMPSYLEFPHQEPLKTKEKIAVSRKFISPCDNNQFKTVQ